MSNRPYSGCNVVLLWLAQAVGYRSPRYLTFKQALELGGNVRKGEHGTSVYFVKQLQIHEKGADDNAPSPHDAEVYGFNIKQCENFPIASATANQCAFAIRTRETMLRTHS